jgi:parvulin-like peptidyl-prolyl isomerase
VRRLLHEPLVHFLALGALIFAAYSVVNRGAGASSGSIVVTRGRIQSMTAAFTSAQDRPPTQDEVNALIDGYVREEASVREATALGLDRDDPVIRRRLQEKLDFVSAEAGRNEPTDQELGAYLAAHPEDFRAETRFDFRQIFFDRGKRGAQAKADAANALAKLPRVVPKGDRFELDADFTSVSAGDVAMRFGDGFAQALASLPEGTWSGPLTSAYGEHLVLVARREDGRVPTLDEARDAVRREWESGQRLSARDEFERSLVARYKVVVER